MLEKRFYAVSPQLFTADGTSNGVITVASDACSLFKVNMRVMVNASTLPTLQLEIKEIDGDGNIQVGPIAGKLGVPGGNTGPSARTDISAYTVALGATISADEQRRPDIDWSEAMRAMYDEEPTVAMRSVLVDKCGNKIDSVTDNSGINRLAVDGQFHAEVDVQVDVDIDGEYDPVLNPDPDNIGLIGHERSDPTGPADQTQRITAKRGTIDTDVVAQDVSLHDHNGNQFSVSNPLPVSGSFEKFFQLIGDSNWMGLATYDQIIPSFSMDGRTVTLAYFEDEALIGHAIVVYNSDVDYSVLLKRYINNDGEGLLLNDDDVPLNLD